MPAASTHIWLDLVGDGELIELRNGRNRAQVIDDLIARRTQCPDGLVDGLEWSEIFANCE